MIVDEDAITHRNQEQIICFGENLPVVQNYLNPLDRPPKQARKQPLFCKQGHTAILFTMYHRLNSTLHNRSENGIHDITLVDLY